MKFIVDAQLPRRLCVVLAKYGHDATHTLDLPDENATKDSIINQLSTEEQRVVISKDSDFFYSHMAQGRPWKLLMIKTGNISTKDLCDLIDRNWPVIESAFQTHSLVEVDRESVTLVR